MKPTFKHQSAARQLLMQGHIVMAAQPVDAPAGTRAAADALPLPDFHAHAAGRARYHIGLQCLKPYRPTLRALQPLERYLSTYLWLSILGRLALIITPPL